MGTDIWNEYNLKTLTRNNWRASLVPAAAVIPAPIVYIKVAAVKKLVVGFRNGRWSKLIAYGVARLFTSYFL